MSQPGPSPLTAGDKNLSVARLAPPSAAALQPISGRETVPLQQALGRVLALDVVSPIDVPAHDNSAMDGYAFASADLRPQDIDHACVRGHLMAGAPFAGTVGGGRMPAHHDRRGDARRTGHRGAAGTAAEGPQKAPPCTSSPASCARRKPPSPGRRPGGRPPGRARRATLLKPADMGLIGPWAWPRCKWCGACVWRCFPPATNCAAWARRWTPERLRQQPLQPDGRGAAPGHGRGRPGAGARRPGRAAGHAATRGGRSRCGADQWRRQHGRRRLHARSAGQHGRSGVLEGGHAAGAALCLWPAAAPAGQGTPVWLFALPGNPVAALVTFYAFAREALLQLAGRRAAPLPVLQARCTTAIRKRPGAANSSAASSSRAARWLAGAAHRLTGRRRPAQHERGQCAGGAGPRTGLGGRRRTGGRVAV
jgi:molybdopterin molybdotransferase